MAVTDHSEYIGVLNQLDDRDSPLMKTAIGQEFAKNPTGAFISLTKAMAVNELIPGLNPKPHLPSSWEKTIAAANQYYRPDQLTHFIGYEWTSKPDGKYNHHSTVKYHADTAT